MAFYFNSLDHESFMHEALQEAEAALRAGERPIGAVVVHDGKIIGRGRAMHKSRQSQIAHAEMNALLDAEQHIDANIHGDRIIYITVEPCVMCLGAIVMSDIHHIVFALADNWIKPSRMLEMDYVRRHIQNYKGGVLPDASAAMYAQYSDRELRMMREGRA